MKMIINTVYNFCYDLIFDRLITKQICFLKELNKQLTGEKGKVIGQHCDVTDKVEVKKVFDWIDSNYGGVSILVNSAGIGK